METLLKKRIEERKVELSKQLLDKLQKVAEQCSLVWSQDSYLDNVLLASLRTIPKCKLVYAVECHGVQVSANITPTGKIDHFAKGQNLSSRPYMINMKPRQPFLLSPVYISQVDSKPSITAMHQVFDKSGSKLGCIAVDFDIDDLDEKTVEVFEEQHWRQIKGDPSIRKNLFQQERTTSLMDNEIDQVHSIINNFLCKRGVFHAKLHYSSSRATLWLYDKPHEYRLHVLDEIINADVCLVYPSQAYPSTAKVLTEDIVLVLEKFKQLRNADETIYLRSGSLNIINAMVGLNFSCDGSHYMSVNEFLEKSDSFWFGS